MNKFQVFFAVCLFAYASSVSLNSFIKKEWDLFKINYAKQYERIEENLRMQIFAENLNKISEHNKLYKLGQKSYNMKMNKFGDLLLQEFVDVMTGSKLNVTGSKPPQTVFENNNAELPDEIDWTQIKNTVTGVKDQGQCGSCYAFSATAVLESQHALKTGKLVSLSEQNLVDCSSKYGTSGCIGGSTFFAFDYIIANGGIDTEESYPYNARKQQCNYKTDNIGATVKSLVHVKEGSESDLQQAVAQIGPISVAIDANHHSYQFYSQGTYDELSCTTTLDHSVLVVGYGVDESGSDYWLVKNSWGVAWGMDGYMRMSRNKKNQCGIATAACYPIV